MKHHRKIRKFGRVRNQRRALMQGLATSFFIARRIRTTEAKARELRPFVERAITRGRNPTLANRRLLCAQFSEATTTRIIACAAELKDRRGGYTRVVKLGVRASDSACLALLESVAYQGS